MNALERRPALGQSRAIGTFYDARKDSFISKSLFSTNLPDTAFQVADHVKVDVSVKYGDTYQSRFESLEMSPSLRGSFLAGSIPCGGVGRYLMEPRDDRLLHANVQHTINTCDQKLNLAFEGLRDHLQSATVWNHDATHVVTGIEWGLRSVVSVRACPRTDGANTETKALFETLVAMFASRIESLNGLDSAATGRIDRVDASLPLEITAYSEMFEDNDGILLEDFQEACEFLEMGPLHIKSENEGKGWPVTYLLLPVEMLSLFLPVQTPQMRQIQHPAPDALDMAFSLLEDYHSSEQTLKDLKLDLLENVEYTPPNALHDLEERLRLLQVSKRRFSEDIGRTISSVKAGFMDPKELQTILGQYRQGDQSPQIISDVTLSEDKVLEFIKHAVSAGAVYVGHNGVRLESVLPVHPGSEAFVFYFNHAAMGEEQSWKENVGLLAELQQNQATNAVVAIVDCDAISQTLGKARITQYQGSREVEADLAAYRNFMADKCFAECDVRTVETENIQPPIQRRHVTIACPGSKCSVAKVHEWLCPRCMVPVEYGFSDQYIYCHCGRSLHSNYTFKCSSENHGPSYTPYDPPVLLRLLNNLVQTNYLNILILGETGVGKSTFINAMVNYLEFETLDEAVAAEKLNWVIPCSFATQIMDRTNPNRPIEEKHIKIGANDDERDGSKGDSATQRTTVYPVTFQHGESTLTVRLIDTPGIGDSRGVDADKQNMADVLSTLSGYEHVHGILVLLKSNNSRLTITFKYCVKELLTHLHHDAAANMAFGFTNTRISNYTPGDTYGPMKRLLGEHPDVGLRLETPTTYCFDSESFRYLAAYKSGVQMENKPDFDRSWAQSRNEATRLIARFQAIPPHEVKSTMSLNGARQLISELTKPLAKISQTINTNIQIVEDQVEILKTQRIKGDELRNMLHVQKVQMNAEKLDMPRTVCADKDCTEVRDDGKGQNEMVIQYNSHCHPVCYLNDVQADVMSHPGLIRCAAFSGNVNCTKCSHHWQQHLHVLYELHEETVTVIDNGIQQQLANHADELTLKQAAIKQKEKVVEEYRKERETIRNAAARFCVFLKRKSIAPYNDALIAYLDFLIKEEQAKVQAGGKDKRLLSLTEERHKHKEAIELLTRNADGNAVADELSEGGVDRLVQDLYNLKHFGENLKKMKEGITAAHQATYREKPYTVRRKNQPRSTARIVQQQPVNAPSQFRPGDGHEHGSALVKGQPLRTTLRKPGPHHETSSGGGITGQIKKFFVAS